MRKALRTLLFALVGGYAGLMVLGKLAYRTALYPAPRRGLEPVPKGAELRAYTASDGQAVQALVFPRPPGRRTMVFFHGNGEVIADSVDFGRIVAEAGLGFVAVEYRGYGTSPSGSPTEEGLYADAEGVLRTLRDEGHADEDLVLWGSSLGTGVAVEMAARGYGGRLVLFSPFTSIAGIAQRIAPFLPMSAIVTDRYDSMAKVAKVTVPTLIVHGDRDRIVPYDMGVSMAKALPSAELLTVEGAGHNDLFVRDGERLMAAVLKHASK